MLLSCYVSGNINHNIDVSMSREQALATAAKYNLVGEVAYYMDHLDMTPEEALSELDILQE